MRTGCPHPGGEGLERDVRAERREYRAFDGGDHFTFTDGFSLIAICQTQREPDEVWDKLASSGGQEGPCGWVTDRFGVSKLDIKTLEAAYKER